MPVNPPGPTEIECDQCDETTEVELAEFASEPPSWGVDDDELPPDG